MALRCVQPSLLIRTGLSALCQGLSAESSHDTLSHVVTYNWGGTALKSKTQEVKLILIIYLNSIIILTCDSSKNCKIFYILGGMGVFVPSPRSPVCTLHFVVHPSQDRHVSVVAVMDCMAPGSAFQNDSSFMHEEAEALGHILRPPSSACSRILSLARPGPSQGHCLGPCDFPGSDAQRFHGADAPPLTPARGDPAALCTREHVEQGPSGKGPSPLTRAARVPGGATWSGARRVPAAPTRGQSRVRNAACLGL